MDGKLAQTVACRGMKVRETEFNSHWGNILLLDLFLRDFVFYRMHLNLGKTRLNL